MSRKNFMAREQFLERKVNELSEALNKEVQKLVEQYYKEGQELSLKERKEFAAKVRKLTVLYVYDLNKLINLGIRMGHSEALGESHKSLKAHLGKNFDRVSELIRDG